jgi:hypothetical protein
MTRDCIVEETTDGLQTLENSFSMPLPAEPVFDLGSFLDKGYRDGNIFRRVQPAFGHCRQRRRCAARPNRLEQAARLKGETSEASGAPDLICTRAGLS